MHDERPSADVLGLSAEEAQTRLRDAGVFEVRVTQTAPPRGAIAGEGRVVRVRMVGPAIELVVAAFPQLQGELR
jgi:beta-lactam-binding protein with PASTA domain